jgi:hypothetical protein
MRDDPGSEIHCTCCRKSQHRIEKLIAGPAVFICNRCVIAAFAAVTSEGRQRTGWELCDRDARCSFCHEARQQAAAFAERLVVCRSCLKICVGILTDSGPGSRGRRPGPWAAARRWALRVLKGRRSSGGLQMTDMA